MNIKNENEKTVGYIVMGCHYCTFYTLKGSVQDELFKFSSNIPTKMGRGSDRFQRQREKAKANYINNVLDMSKHLFITDTNLNISEVVLCRERGFPEDIDKLITPDLAPYLKNIVVITYGGYNGLQQAIHAMKMKNAIENAK
jgi:peptide subunit release factor 1 (eRF1)